MRRITADVYRVGAVSLFINLLYAVYNGILGFYVHPWWFVCVSSYYVILSIMRFSVVMCGYKRKDKDTGYFIMRFSGAMLFVLSLILSASVYLTLKYEIGHKYHEIVMITIATYTFTKITLAIINLVKSGKAASPLLTTLRSISVADGVVSIFSMQRSMLTSFGSMAADDIWLFKLLTGIGVCVAVSIIGIYLIRKDMVKWRNQN